jgi:hypothetical protein
MVVNKISKEDFSNIECDPNHVAANKKYSKYMLIYSKYTRVLTLQNLCQEHSRHLPDHVAAIMAEAGASSWVVEQQAISPYIYTYMHMYYQYLYICILSIYVYMYIYTYMHTHTYTRTA